MQAHWHLLGIWMTSELDYNHLPMHWVGDFSARRAQLTPQREAVFDAQANTRVSFAELNDIVQSVCAKLLYDFKLMPGDRVAFIGNNGLTPISLQLACAAQGIVFAPLSYRLAANDIRGLLARVRPKRVIYEEAYAHLLTDMDLPSTIYRDWAHWLYQIEFAIAPTKPALSQANPAMIIHTGGSTGLPKLCLIPFRQLYWNIYEILAFGWGGLQFRELVTFPFFHVGGWNSFLSMFHSGGHCTITSRFDPAQCLALIARERIQHFGAVEAMLIGLQEHPNFANTDFGSLQHIHTAGAPCRASVMQPFWDRNIPVSQVYGMTEAGPSNFGYLPADPALVHCKTHAHVIGTPMSHSDFKIVHPMSRQAVATGDIGVLCMRSAHNFGGYLDDSEQTAAILDEQGWVYSGDLARVSAEGFVEIIGRVDHMFISGGENIMPEEIERVLCSHSDVQSAICCGIPHPRWGQTPYAQVALRADAQATETDLLHYCENILPRYKMPTRIDLVTQIPLTGSGKPDRHALRRYAQSEPR
jgi:fatty-acyl-CoA synthase